MIQLNRFVKDNAATLGKLTYGDHTYYTVERPWRDNRPFVSCIPDGEYKMRRVNSPKFGEDMWEIVDVPGRTHILLHVANGPGNVMGCIGLGQTIYPNLKGVGSSRKAIDAFYDLTAGVTEETISITTGAVSA